MVTHPVTSHLVNWYQSTSRLPTFFIILYTHTHTTLLLILEYLLLLVFFVITVQGILGTVFQKFWEINEVSKTEINLYLSVEELFE